MESKGLSLTPQGLKKWVVNLTNKTLTKDQESVLELGLNFAPAPTKLPILDTIAGVELGAYRLGMDEASDLRGKVCGMLKKAKLPADNLKKDQRKALKELRVMKDVAILPADKGNATVLLDMDDYDAKLTQMLSTGSNGKLDKDPTQVQEGRIT